MKWREITEEEVKLTLSGYDKIEDSVKGRKNAFKKIGTRLIIEVCISKGIIYPSLDTSFPATVYGGVSKRSTPDTLRLCSG